MSAPCSTRPAWLPQVVAEAMVAVLPGLDANDEVKTLSTLYFLTCVLSSGVQLGMPGEVEEDPGRDNAKCGWGRDLMLSLVVS